MVTFFRPLYRHCSSSRPYHTLALLASSHGWQSKSLRYGLWMSATATLGLAASMSMAYSEAKSPNDAVIETTTGFAFPKSIHFGDGTEHVLVGVGPRQITFLKLSVYGVGIYVEKQALAKIIQAIRTAASLQPTQAAMDAMIKQLLLDAPVEMSIKIIPFRNTTGSHMRNGFARSLTQRYTAIPNLEPETAKVAIDHIVSDHAIACHLDV